MAEPATRAREMSRNERGAPGFTRRCSTCGAEYPIDFVVCPKDATPLERADGVADDPLIGEVLAGSFLITQLLGEGGMGRVYEAEHVRLPRRFAVKVMLESLAENAEAMARFEREAQAIARVASEHVLEVVDVVRTKDGRPCIVSELLEGEELGEVAERLGTCELAQAIEVCRQVCRGLAAAHAVGVVHRDLKPSNLYLVRRADGATHVKILDFGVAKVTDGADLTRTGMVVGTPAFMAPEQGRGSSQVDARADIYSVGAVLYRLLTGETPFGDGDPTVVLTRLLTEDPKRPRSLNRAIPEGVELLVQRAMARSPADRPATALELERQLAAFAVAGGITDMSSRRLEGSAHAIATMDTVALANPSSVRQAEDQTKLARRARPSAMVFSFGVAAVVGSTVLAGVAAAIRVIAARMKYSEVELSLIGVLSGLATLVVLVSSLRVLVTRWRSAPAVERLARGLRGAFFAPLALLGALALAWTIYGLLGPRASEDEQAAVGLAVVVAPLLVALIAFGVALRRASRR